MPRPNRAEAAIPDHVDLTIAELVDHKLQEAIYMKRREDCLTKLTGDPAGIILDEPTYLIERHFDIERGLPTWVYNPEYSSEERGWYDFVSQGVNRGWILVTNLDHCTVFINTSDGLPEVHHRTSPAIRIEEAVDIMERYVSRAVGDGQF